MKFFDLPMEAEIFMPDGSVVPVRVTSHDMNLGAGGEHHTVEFVGAGGIKGGAELSKAQVMAASTEATLIFKPTWLVKEVELQVDYGTFDAIPYAAAASGSIDLGSIDFGSLVFRDPHEPAADLSQIEADLAALPKLDGKRIDEALLDEAWFVSKTHESKTFVKQEEITLKTLQQQGSLYMDIAAKIASALNPPDDKEVQS